MTTITADHFADLAETFRADVLEAMDKSMSRTIASQCSGLAFPDNCTGARDADLPALFLALDRQLALNLRHGGVTIEDRPQLDPSTRSGAKQLGAHLRATGAYSDDLEAEDKAHQSYTAKTWPGA